MKLESKHPFQKDYKKILKDISQLLETGRGEIVSSANSIFTSTYWAIGFRIVQCEQKGSLRANYGDEIIKKLAVDLTQHYGRGFAKSNLYQMRAFYLTYAHIFQTTSGKSQKATARQIFQTLSGKSHQIVLLLKAIAERLPLAWSAYVLLLAIQNEQARKFYETEALRGGWSVRQLDRQINSQFYERTLLSKNKTKMLTVGTKRLPEDKLTPDEAIKDPCFLEFLNLKDEYSENDLEEALIEHLETFLLEMGSDFCFVGRQRRLRIGDVWYRVDLVFYHRRLHCLVLIDLKLGKFTHADAGQMHLYLNYAREHWTHLKENPPVGLILCASKNEAVVKYALENLPNKVLAATYRTALPKEKELLGEIEKTRILLTSRRQRITNFKNTVDLTRQDRSKSMGKRW